MSLLKTNAVQIGNSNTATHNFTLYQPTSPDGTVRLGVGNAGSTVDIAVFNGNSKLVFPASNGSLGQMLSTDGAGNLVWAAGVGGGSGLFNTNISSMTGYAVTNSMSTAYVAPGTAGYRYIVHSIHVTNIDGASSADISGQFIGSTYTNIAVCNTVPVPAGSSVELLKKPKVLHPNDVVQLQASANSMLHASIVIEVVEGTQLFGAGVDIADAGVYVNLHTATANSVIESVLLANDDGASDVQARVVWTDGSDTIQGYFAYNIIVPADSTVEVLEQPKYLSNGYKVKIYCDAANRLEAIIAGKVV
jgi:hypothetical protein